MAISLELIKELREKSGAGISDCKKALEENNSNIADSIAWLRAKGIAKAAKKEGRIAAEGITKAIVLDNEAFLIEVNTETDFAAKSDTFLGLVNSISLAVSESKASSVEEALLVPVGKVTLKEEIEASTGRIGEKVTLRRVAKLVKTENEVFGSYVHFNNRIGVLVVLKSEKFVEDALAIAEGVATNIAGLPAQYISEKEIPADIIKALTETNLKVVKEDPKFVGKPEKMLQGIVKGKVDKVLQELTLTHQDYFAEPGKTVGQFLTEKGFEVVSFVRFEVGEGIEKRVDDFAAEVARQVSGN